MSRGKFSVTGETTLLAKLAGDFKDCEWIYRFGANPGMPRGGVLPPTPVLAPEPRSGRVPALPYPPPRLVQCTADQVQRAIHGWTKFSIMGGTIPLEPRAPRGIGYQDPHPEENCPRGAECNAVDENVKIYKSIYK